MAGTGPEAPPRALLQSCHSRWRDHPRSPIQFSDHADCDGALFFKHAAELGLEGIVSKRAKSLRHATAECKLADNLRCPYKLVSIRWLRRGAPTLATSNARIVLNKRRVNALAMFSSMEWSIGFRWLE